MIVKGRRTFEVKGACPHHGEDTVQILKDYTFSEARIYTWDCPHEDDGNKSVQVIEILDTKTHQVIWERPFIVRKIGEIEHRYYKFD
jgi:hypothetical protein